MKTLWKFLHYSRKLEELQTARKAKEVDEIRKFDVQTDAQNQRNFDRHLKSDRSRLEHHIRDLERLSASEQAWMSMQLQCLHEVKAFDDHVQHSKSDILNNDVEQFLDLQTGMPERTHNGSTALSSVTYDIFADEIRDVTESELQRELQQNEEAIYENQTRSSRSRAAWPKAEQHQTGLEEPFEKNASRLDQERFSEPQVEEEHNQERPSSGNVFYFRQMSSPKK
ncbi:MAG: hypothetical protein RBT80_06590 [Candidatus Vecturithrix sp.]|nr:hypothetical protein [Candidatus Vecturithrix sp.]